MRMNVLSTNCSFQDKNNNPLIHFLKTSILLLTIFVGTHFSFAADLVTSPSTGSYSIGQTFTVTIQADPSGGSVDAVEAALTFDKSKLSIVNVSKTGSVFSLWTTEPTFSNTAGTISFGGRSSTPLKIRSTLMSVTFRALAEGTGTVSFGTASVLSAGDLNTEVLKGKVGGNYVVTATAAPEVGSVTFLDPDVWYNKVNGLFTWDIPFDVIRLAVEIATSSENEPSKIIDPPVNEFTVSAENLVDGIQYLSIQFQNQVGWGAVTNRKIQIDTTPPEKFTINVQAGTTQSSFPLLGFEAFDKTSGVVSYELIVADKEPVIVSYDEAKLGYLLKELEDGVYTVKVTAIDRAGNETVSSVPVLITAGWTKQSDAVEPTSSLSFLTGTAILLAFLVLTIILQFVYIIYEKKQYNKKVEKLRIENREVQDQVEKIFSALRDEIYDQINNITKRPRLSAKEKSAVEGLNQALEVSETLIKNDLSKKS